MNQEYEYEEEIEERNDMIPLLNLIVTWFIRIGLVFAGIAFFYYVAMGEFFTAFLYIIGLILAYFFGYFFMFCLDKLFTE